jgi:CBS domain-containing protein
VPHLRIENRALPSGPTVADEIANAAFFSGLMLALPEEYGEIAKKMVFEDAKANFFRAARHGLDAQLRWIDGQTLGASTLILNHLLPLAKNGLSSANVSNDDIDRYLGIIEERARRGQTGARWITKSFAAMGNTTSKDTRRTALTSAMLSNQKQGQPVHLWPVVEVAETEQQWEQRYQVVSQFMSTDLFTVHPGDLIDLAASAMDWRHIRHVPVEDEDGRLVGLVTHRGLLRMLSGGTGEKKPITVREIMVENPVTVTPATSSLEAMDLMRGNRVGCLPVVEDNRLVGIVTSYDFLEATANLFRQHLSKAAPGKALSRAVTSDGGR